MIRLKVGDKFQTKHTIKTGVFFKVIEVDESAKDGKFYLARGSMGMRYHFSEEGVMHPSMVDGNTIDWSTVVRAPESTSDTFRTDDSFLTWEAAT